mmetsp:Transcript_149868/g.364036  ORF Transcript_149868/g.364036 Transcript_149868/m.364036 type:complete len:271 (-) Transcript_149868:182-994(-)
MLLPNRHAGAPHASEPPQNTGEHVAPVPSRHAGAPSEQPGERVARDDRLGDGAAEGDHGQPAVLELRQAHPPLALLVLGKERKSEAVVASTLQGVPLENLLCTTELKECNPEEDLEVDAHGAVELVVRVDGHGAGLEGVALPWDPHEVRDGEAHPGEHGDAPVLQLGLAEEGHELSVLGEADRVELVRPPRALGADEALRKLAVVHEVDAGVPVGDGKIAPRRALHQARLGRAPRALDEPRANGSCSSSRQSSHAERLLCRRHRRLLRRG